MQALILTLTSGGCLQKSPSGVPPPRRRQHGRRSPSSRLISNSISSSKLYPPNNMCFDSWWILMSAITLVLPERCFIIFTVNCNYGFYFIFNVYCPLLVVEISNLIDTLCFLPYLIFRIGTRSENWKFWLTDFMKIFKVT